MNDESTLLQQHLLLRNACVDPNLSNAAKAVLAVILDHYNIRQRTAYPGFDRMARIAGIHRSSVMRAVDALEAAGYLEVTRRERRANVYSIPSWPTTRDWPGSTGSTGATSPAEQENQGQSLQNSRVAPRRGSAVERVRANVEAAERNDRATGSAHATSPHAAHGITGSTGATQLVVPAPSTGSTAAHQLVAPAVPEPSFKPTEPAVEPAATDQLANKRAWINHRFRLGDLTQEEAAAELRALC
ncbi:helix-turn-helix domain-containing protein [Luteimonas sp. A478]